MLRILLADDHAVVRQGLRKILQEEFHSVAFGEAQNGLEALDLAAKSHWDVIVLDLSMPVKCGLDVLKELKRRGGCPPVLVLSIHSDVFYAVRAFRAGAAGYLTKQSAPEELVLSVRKVLAGGRYVTPSVAEALAADLEADTEKPLHHNLADREYQVMCLIAAGKSPNEIAGQLALSPKTISTYRTRILQKMHMKTNAELAVYAVQHGLIPAQPKQ